MRLIAYDHIASKKLIEVREQAMNERHRKKHHNHHVLEYKLYLADILCTIVSSLKTQKVACM